jgi:hypothetical protein
MDFPEVLSKTYQAIITLFPGEITDALLATVIRV